MVQTCRNINVHVFYTDVETYINVYGENEKADQSINQCAQYMLNYYLLLYSWFNKSPYQQLRSFKRHEEKKSKIGQEPNSMQQADYQFHSNTP